MGTLKMLHMKQCKGKNKARHLKNALKYIFNPEKSSQRWMGGNAGSSAEEVYENMIRLKKMLGKENGRQGYHFILTFKPGEVDENLACQITEEFCEAYLKNQFQHTFVLHNDKAHMHTHIIFNSIDMNGYKYHYADGDWGKKIQPIVNALCKKHGLSEINLEKESEKNEEIEKEKKGKRTGKQYQEKVDSREGGKKESSKNRKQADGASREKRKDDSKKNDSKEGSKDGGGMDSGRNTKTDGQKGKKSYRKKWEQERKNLCRQIKEDINAAIVAADDLEGFYDIMKGRGYKIHIGSSKVHGEFISFRFGERKGVRSYTLGEGFSVSDIQYQIQNKEKLAFARQYFADDGGKRYQRVYLHAPENLRRLYLKNTYLIRNWKGERLSMFPQMYKYRKSLEELRMTEEECNYVCDLKIENIEQILEKLNYVEYKIKQLGKLRFDIVNNNIEMTEGLEREERLREVTREYAQLMREKSILVRIKIKSGQMEREEEDIAEKRTKSEQREESKSAQKEMEGAHQEEDRKL